MYCMFASSVDSITIWAVFARICIKIIRIIDLMFLSISYFYLQYMKMSGVATTPDKTVETFQYNFQFRTMLPLCPKGTNSPSSPPLVQCCFGSAAQACISCVTANNIAIGEGGNSLLICGSKHFCQSECKK